MSSPILPAFTDSHVWDQRWSWAIGAALVSLLVFMPLAFGAVEAWSELVVVSVAAGMTVALTLRSIIDRSYRYVATWTYLPLFLFLLTIVFQLVPLPSWLAELVAPSTVTTRQELLASELGTVDAGEASVTAASTADPQTTVSFYPRGTQHGLRMVLIGTAVFVVVVNTFRHRQQIVLLLAAVFIVGCIEACLALLQIATLSTQIYWSIGASGGRIVTAGSFVNYSHFSQFMNLSIGAGLALLLVRLHRHRPEGSRHLGTSPRMESVSWDKHGWILCGLIVCAISVLTSLSRNGAISMCVAATVVGMALYSRGSMNTRGWILVAVPFGVLIGLLTFGFDQVYDRLATLEDGKHFSDRLELTTGTLRAWLTYPIWGTGLETHEFVFPAFDPAAIVSVAAHADNDYAQLLEETGVVGAALVATFLFMVVALGTRLMRKGRTSLSTAAYGLSYGLIAVAIHSLSDFGQRLPAIFSLSAISCALLVAITRYETSMTKTQAERPGTQTEERALIKGRVLAIVALIGLVLIWSWTIRETYASYLGESWRATALAVEEYVQDQQSAAEDQDYIDLIAASEQAGRWDPLNVKYGYWLNLYRWQAISRAVDPETNQTLLHPDVLPFAARICEELSHVRSLCPLYGSPYALEGQIRLFVLEEQRGADLIKLGYELSPSDPPTCLVAGELAARNDETELATAALTRAVKLVPGYYPEVARILVHDLHRPDLAQELAGDNHTQLQQLAEILSAGSVHVDLAEQLRAAAEASLRKAIQNNEATPEELTTAARMDVQSGDHASAVELFRRALSLRYNRVDWRLSLAKSLAEIGRVDEAMHEARICLRLRPQYAPARRLIEELSVRTGEQ